MCTCSPYKYKKDIHTQMETDLFDIHRHTDTDSQTHTHTQRDMLAIQSPARSSCISPFWLFSFPFPFCFPFRFPFRITLFTIWLPLALGAPLSLPQPNCGHSFTPVPFILSLTHTRAISQSVCKSGRQPVLVVRCWLLYSPRCTLSFATP